MACLLGALLWIPSPVRGQEGLGLTESPVLVVEAPPALEPIAERVRGYDTSRLGLAMRLTGLTRPGGPIRVALVQEGSGAARSAPDWASGYAHGEKGTVVLIPARASDYPYGSLEALLHHEVTHVLVARAARGRPVPRWFNEGLAMAAAREWGFSDLSRLALELLPGSRVPASRLDELFDRTSRTGADRAYALSAAFVRDLIDRYGPDFPGRVLASIARGESFDNAFRGATGVTLDGAAGVFYRSQTLWSLWIPVLASSATIWTIATLLFLWAVKRRRVKSEKIRRIWEIEEQLAGMEATGPVAPSGPGDVDDPGRRIGTPPPASKTWLN